MAQDARAILAALNKAFEGADLSDLGTREILRRNARKLQLSLEEGVEVWRRIGFQVQEASVLKVAIDMGLLKALAAHSDTPQTVAQLAKSVKGGDEVLTARILRVLEAYQSIIPHPDPHGSDSTAYTPARPAVLFATPTYEAGMQHTHDFLSPAWLALPRHLARTGYRNPTDNKRTALSLARNMDGSAVFDILSADPTSRDAFNTWVSHSTGDGTPWSDIYPLTSRLRPPFDPNKALFVDIGGGLGHQALRFRTTFPSLPGTVTTQDLSSLVARDPEQATRLRDADVEMVEHDFFHPQPPASRGAALYYLRWVLHDWPDAAAVRILTNVRAAMTPGYSRVLLNEWVLDFDARDSGPVPVVDDAPPITTTTTTTTATPTATPLFAANMDVNMMSAGAGMERSAAQFRSLMAAAGLRVTGIWTKGDGVSIGVVEGMVA